MFLSYKHDYSMAYKLGNTSSRMITEVKQHLDVRLFQELSQFCCLPLKLARFD